MAGRILQPASEISTHFRCDHCGILLDKVNWMQCKFCRAFDLCADCTSIPYDELSSETLSNHQKLHKDTLITGNFLKLVSVKVAETNGNQARINRRQKEYERIVSEKKIENDYDMAVVMDKLADNQVNSLVLDYYHKANQRDIRILSLDGGGKNNCESRHDLHE